MSPHTALGSLVHCWALGVHHWGCTYPHVGTSSLGCHMASTLEGPAAPETGGAASSGPRRSVG